MSQDAVKHPTLHAKKTRDFTDDDWALVVQWINQEEERTGKSAKRRAADYFGTNYQTVTDQYKKRHGPPVGSSKPKKKGRAAAFLRLSDIELEIQQHQAAIEKAKAAIEKLKQEQKDTAKASGIAFVKPEPTPVESK